MAFERISRFGFVNSYLLEGPRGQFEEVTVEATRSEVVIEERGWRFEHVRRRPSSGG